jgi:hypothetical protein
MTRAGAYAYLDEDFDPWESVDDLDGEAHYRVLGVPVRASPDEIKAAYRSAIKTHHPDKGGDPAKFAILQTAWEVRLRPPALGNASSGALPHWTLRWCSSGRMRRLWGHTDEIFAWAGAVLSSAQCDRLRGRGRQNLEHPNTT